MADVTTIRNTIAEIDAALERLGAGAPETTEKVDLLNEKAMNLVAIDRAAAIDLGTATLQIAERLGYEKGKAYSLGITGYALYFISDFSEALPRLLDALALFEKIDDPYGKGLVLSAMGGLYISLGDYERALSCSLESLTLSRATGSELEEAWCLNGLGTGYFEIGDDTQALKYYQEGLKVFREIGDHVGEARTLTGIGAIHQHSGDYKAARACFLDSLKLFQLAENKTGEARALNDLGRLSQLMGEEDVALAYHGKSLAIREKVGSRQAQCTSLINLGRLFIQQKAVDKALDVLNQALNIAEEITARPRMYQAHEALSEVYVLKNDVPKALEHFRAFHQIKSAVLGEEANARLSNLKVAHEVEKARVEAEVVHLRNVSLKEKNDQLEQLLRELIATQKQLIQSEKMASLGQLTAGIAHEIKNPLNFVNNFATLSVELTHDLREVLLAQPEKPLRLVLDEIEDLLTNIEMTAEKINEHGRRADEIVRSMLLHSRQKPGESQPTNLNDLLNEYVNLAYHGMRANVENFNVTLERDFDVTVKTVHVIAQEMGRVFLNMLNNAFYAVHEQAVQSGTKYAPTVWISTCRKGDVVEIRLRDNGPGISEEIRDRIFEPFFTTKPTGEGTGLGLSLSYDIVTKGHGGTMTMEHVETGGTEFIITLPMFNVDAQRAKFE